MTTKPQPFFSHKSESSSLLEDQLVDMAFITNFTGMTDKWFYKLISEGEFPAPVKLGRSSRWFRSDIEEWLQSRIKASTRRKGN
ncbi:MULTISPECIES: helix-turn-helix transcriptional regulator [Enterobacteriaceae]|uniref:helix-turn-helix transcriptional regulator n=1 Tax=Enterobacteriaceae TaxID=543 RepID=UPI0023E3BCC8|nr:MULTISPECIES: AlpA family phage regulatory protein [unclassified Pseudocitrobacter]MDF3829808.1 AlpA family phage regulatory protein [Pseudocitrobacter sp. 2023EL-00150]MEC5375487.1 AlpA family phage regulatory protein [Pseudocitrobacter sp. MW920760]